MHFSTTNQHNYNQNFFKLKLLRWAKIRILAHSMGPTELLLDKYLKAHYKTGLKSACIFLTYNVEIDATQSTDVRVYFKNDQFEKMARIITFGTGKLLGSRILLRAFAPIPE